MTLTTTLTTKAARAMPSAMLKQATTSIKMQTRTTKATQTTM
jgi:hypothetical protein